MFGSSFSGSWLLPDGWQDYLCTIVVAACVSGDPSPQNTPQADAPQPQAAAVQPQEPAVAPPTSPEPAKPAEPAQSANATPEVVAKSTSTPVTPSKPTSTQADSTPASPVQAAKQNESTNTSEQVGPVAENKVADAKAAVDPAPKKPEPEKIKPVEAESQPKVVSVHIEASPTVIEKGDPVHLTWSSENATNCQASGAWARARATSGSVMIKALYRDADYRLSCSGVGATGAMARAQVHVRETKPVELSFRAAPVTVNPGESTELVWNAKNADECTADGDWQGKRALAGRFDTGALTQDATFTIRCRNQGDEEVSLVRVSVEIDRFRLSWRPPGQNVDGTRARDVSGYRIYWGRRPNRYTNSTTIHSADTTEWVPDLSPGTYYFAISAFDSSGNESEKSAPVRAKI